MKVINAAILIFIFLIVLFALALTGCANDPSVVASEGQNEIALKLDEFMSAFNENCSYKYSGSILVAKGDEIFLNNGYGMSNYEKNIPNEPGSVFAIGSITKTFTAVAIMQLQENGLINVNDPISKYGLDHKRGDDVTIHHLLTHTSGLLRDGIFRGKQPVALSEHVDFISNTSLLFEPGEEYSYSNSGYQLLAAIIEKVSGKSYNAYIQDSIFRPLAMSSSVGGTDASYADGQSLGYQITPRGSTQLSIYDLSNITGSGNIYSTVEDLFKFERGIQEGKLLTEESIDQMLTPHWGEWQDGYGYGWEVTEKFHQKKFSHSGNIAGGGYVSSLIRYPEAGYVLIFLTNNADTTALNVVSESIEAILFGEDYVIPQKTTDIQLSSEVLRQYAGEYDLGVGPLISIQYENDKLYSTADDGNLYELLPIDETSFQYEDHQWVTAEFFVDRENDSTRIRIQNIGMILEGVKVTE